MTIDNSNSNEESRTPADGERQARAHAPDGSRLTPVDVSELLIKWIETAQKYAIAHRMEAIILKKRHTQIGAPSVVLSAVVGTSIFAAIQEAAQSFALKSLLALLSMTAAALAALITFYSFQERAAAHRIASEEYDDVARRLEVLRTSLIAMIPKDWRNVLDGYSQTLEAIGRRADLPPSMISQKRKRSVLSEGMASNMMVYGGQFTGTQRGMAQELRRRMEEEFEHTLLQRRGFPEELQHVFFLATGSE